MSNRNRSQLTTNSGICRARSKRALGFLGTSIIALGAVCFVIPSANASTVPIGNSSFEADILADGSDTNNTVMSWSSSVGAYCSPYCFGAFNPAVGHAGFPGGSVPDGNNALYMVSDTRNLPVFQVLTGSTYQANTQYTLTIAVGNPADRADTATFGFELGVVGSANTYASYGASLSTIPNGGFADRTSSSAIFAGNPDIGGTLVVRLYGPLGAGPGKPYVAFDNIRLTAALVPEPGTYALMLVGLGLVGFIAGRRRT